MGFERELVEKTAFPGGTLSDPLAEPLAGVLLQLGAFSCAQELFPNGI